jgi:ubiquinol-cytochrome c reductase cytochrome b subunit
VGVDYSRQYRPSQLEPFFPNELIKMLVSVLVTLAVIVAIALLAPEPEEQPADPRNTPAHIKPEWYFLATYQSLKLMPQSFLGVSGKLLGVALQGALFAALLTVPFWYRRAGRKSPLFRLAVTSALGLFLALTVWGLWPEDASGRLEPPGVFLGEHPVFVVMTVLAVAAFAAAMLWEWYVIRRDWRA